MGDRFATIDTGRGFTDAGLPASVQQAYDGKLYLVNYGTKATTPALWFLLSSSSSFFPRSMVDIQSVKERRKQPILSGRRLDVYHTSTHDLALVRI